MQAKTKGGRGGSGPGARIGQAGGQACEELCRSCELVLTSTDVQEIVI